MNLHGPVRVAEFADTAKVVVGLDAWLEGMVAPTIHEITILPPGKEWQAEAVTKRLFATLQHPDRKSTVGLLTFAPDNSRLLMAGYPSGVVQIWDTKTWKEKTRFDTPHAMRSSWNFALPTGDWRSILVPVRTRKPIRDEVEGKIVERVQIDGRINVYDANTGNVHASIPMANRGPLSVFVLPDRKALVETEGSSSATSQSARSTELVDLATQSTKKLFDSFSQPAVSADGKTIYFSLFKARTGGAVDTSLVKYDLTAGKVLKTKENQDTFWGKPTLFPYGKLLFVVTGRVVKLRIESYALAVLDTDTLDVRARIDPGAKEELTAGFDDPQFSADGGTMITRSGGRFIVWDVAARKTVRTVAIAGIQAGRLLLSHDGKRAVLVGMPPFDPRSVGSDPDNLPQILAYLIDLSDPESKPERLVLPNGPLGGAAISPDWKTLAVGGAGRVYLLNVSGRVKAKP